MEDTNVTDEGGNSRRLVLGAALGAMAGALPLLTSGAAEAAPSDIKGSPNVAVATYGNQNDLFVVWADGSISKAKTGERIASPSPHPYPQAAGFTRTQAVGGRPSGAPNVCIDVVQDKDGTYLLFADGSLRTPNNTGAAAPPYANVKFYSFNYIRQGSVSDYLSPGLTRSGHDDFSFDKPFSEPPLVWVIAGTGGFAHYMSGHPAMRVSTRGFSYPFQDAPSNNAGIIIGKV